MSHLKWTLDTALAQIASCNYECEAGPVEMNDAFIWMREQIEQSTKVELAFNAFTEKLTQKHRRLHEALTVALREMKRNPLDCEAGIAAAEKVLGLNRS